jgi:imidazolonepropionase-like amidohydrolase
MKATRFVPALVLAAFVGLSSAQDKTADPPKDQKKPDPAKDAKKAEPKKPVTAVVGADIYTVTRGVVRNGVVLIQDGKILRVGQDIAIPDGATTIDATGKVVAPGFVAVSASGVAVRTLGSPAPGGGPPGPGGANPPKFADALNPFDRNIQFCLAAGITTACVEVAGGPGGRFGRDTDDEPLDDTRLCPCCGMAILPTEPIGPTPPTERTSRRSAALKMAYGDLNGMMVKESPFYHVTPGSFAGALNRHQWRETIRKARQQVKDHAAAAADESTPGPTGVRRGVPDDVIKLVEKKIPLRVDASSAEQMREMIALAKELDYNLVLDGVHEAWLIANELSGAKVQAVLTPRSRRRHQPGREDSTGSSIETSSHLEKAGVPFAVAPLSNSVSIDGLPGRDLTSLPLEAAFAVRGGCSEQTALEALTIIPARLLGLGDRVGSIEEGKDADLLILDGHPLDYHTFVDKAIVNGSVRYDRAREKIFPPGMRQVP